MIRKIFGLFLIALAIVLLLLDVGVYEKLTAFIAGLVFAFGIILSLFKARQSSEQNTKRN
ncbi:MAG: hypothetical protein MAGBODY4_01288 [Candidatus Marinimicrobia bacterium]|nr:hypothetical protein [Candidatus Neomarinimicrobiota bacterium]